MVCQTCPRKPPFSVPSLARFLALRKARAHSQVTSCPQTDDAVSQSNDVKPFAALPGPGGLKAVPFIGTMFMMKPFGELSGSMFMMKPFGELSGSMFMMKPFGELSGIRTLSKATLGKLLRDGVERIWAFSSA